MIPHCHRARRFDMLIRNPYFIFTTLTLLVTLSALPQTASAGFRSADLSIRNSALSRTEFIQSDLYKVRGRDYRHDRRHERYRYHRRNRHEDRRIILYSPYYPYYSPIWDYPPYSYDLYYRGPRSGITFYFGD